MILDIKEFETKYLCNIGVGIAVAGGVGAAATAYSASKAADAQKDAAQAGINAQQAQYSQTRADLSPYRSAGNEALTYLQQNGYYAAPITLSQDWLESTPGYQFTKTQGLKAVQNAAAARGLGISGAALKGAANFATGLADNTYQTQFNAANINNTNSYNRLKGIVDTGQNAAAQTGTFGANAANQTSSLLTGAGNAQAAASNTIGGSISNLANNLGGYYAYKGLYGNTGNSVPAAQQDYWNQGNTGPINWG